MNIQVSLPAVALLLSIGIVLGNSGVTHARDDSQTGSAEFQSAIRAGNCDAARNLVIDVSRAQPSLPSLPKMYYQVIECDKGDWRDLGISIIDFYSTQIDSLARQGRCTDAEEAWRRIDPRFRKIHTGSGDAIWLFRVASCYESVNVKKSIELFENLIRLHPDHDKAGESRLKVNWLKGDRKWVFRDLNRLVEAISRALGNRDLAALERYSSKSRFAQGFESHPHPGPFDENTRSFFRKVFESYSPAVGSIQAKDERSALLGVTFPDQEYPLWLFLFEKVDGGWQWTGIVITSEKPKSKANDGAEK